MVYISIHSLRMEGDSAIVQCALFQHISIHSLRMEGDGFSIIYSFLTCISIHSLRMEGDVLFSIFIIPRRAFQSTPSAWRETVAEVYFCLWLWYFNPLPPHGGRLGTQTEKNRSEVFQSTPSAWRETSDMRKCYHCIFISIHSLRMEGDPVSIPIAATR